MTEHDERTGARLLTVASIEETTDGRAHAERLKVVDRHHPREDTLRRILHFQSRGTQDDLVCVHSLEGGDAATDLEVIRIRNGRHTGALTRLEAHDVDERSRSRHAVGRSQQETIDDGEDRRRCADADRQRERRGGREEGVAAEQASGVADIEERRLYKGAGAHAADLLFDRLDTTEFEQGAPPGFVGRKAGLPLFIDQQLQSSPHFGVELVLDAIAVEQIANETHDAGNEGHRPGPVTLRGRLAIDDASYRTSVGEAVSRRSYRMSIGARSLALRPG